MAVLALAALTYGAVYDNVTLALGIAALLLTASVLVALGSRGRLGSRVGLPVLGMAMVGLVIHVARGHAEAHFAVFAFLAVTVVYRHWLPIVVGAAAIAVHHLSFNFFQQWGWGPVCFTEPGLWTVFEHAAYVVGEAVILVMLAARSRAEFAANAQLSRIACRLVAADGSIDFRAAHVDAPTPAAAQMITALQRIEATIATVRASADAIGMVSDDMAQGSSDLSARTQQTGGHLQHASQAMTQLGGTVQSASNAAGQADEVARSAFAVARQGGDVVKQVVTTMGDIQAASRRIADIIGVVDGLAFQTNILALNAGVEAARAGEHGRGFAVVAAEVRSLARRSADAAHEIKSLIGANVERVETGTALVNQAGATVQDIVGNVQQVHHIVGEIAAASAAQRSDIGAVTGTMAQLGAMTQQNAALVQQSAAAVDSLRAQSARLTEAVRLFRLGAAAAAPVAAPLAARVAEPPGVRQAA